MRKTVSFAVLFLLLFSVTASGYGGNLQVMADSPSALGSMVKITGIFENTGSSPVPVSFSCDIYLKDELVQHLESEQLSVKPGETAELPVYFEPDEVGIYKISGRAEYLDRLTTSKVTYVSVEIPTRTYPEIGMIIPLETEIGIILALVAVLGVTYLLRGKSREEKL